MCIRDRASLEQNDQDAVKKGVEELTKAQHKVAEKLYSQAQAPSGDAPGGEQARGAGASGGGSGAGSEDVIDAEVVEDKK